jgi:hypothetical protein
VGAALLAYSIALGGENPGQVIRHLFLGPKKLALEGGDYYTHLHLYILQMLQHNILPILVCGLGLALALLRVACEGSAERRVAALFSVTIAVLVFTHSQPWPYVFIMVVPFLALWGGEVLSAAVGKMSSPRPLVVLLVFGAVLSLARNVYYLGHDNREQLGVLSQAESMLLPGESYLDGIGMVAQRPDAGRAWWDQPATSALHARPASGEGGVLDEVFAAEPKIVILSYRTASVGPVLAPYLEGSYVRIRPNLMAAGMAVRPGETKQFMARWSGDYRLYGLDGVPISSTFTVDGTPVRDVVSLALGRHRVALPPDAPPVLLLPRGMDPFRFPPGPDRPLFAHVYN